MSREYEYDHDNDYDEENDGYTFDADTERRAMFPDGPSDDEYEWEE